MKHSLQQNPLEIFELIDEIYEEFFQTVVEAESIYDFPDSESIHGNSSNDLEVYDRSLEPVLNELEEDLQMDFSESLDGVGYDNALQSSGILGYATRKDQSTNYDGDRIGENFVGLNPDLQHMPYELRHTLIHELGHATDFNQEFMEMYRQNGGSMQEAALLKDQNIKGRQLMENAISRHDLKKGRQLVESATEYAARELNDEYGKVKSNSYENIVRQLESEMKQAQIKGKVSSLLEDREVEEVEYDPWKEYLEEEGRFEVDGEEFEYSAEINELNMDYRNEELLDKGIEYVMENPGEDWDPDYAEVKVSSGYKGSEGIKPGEVDGSVSMGNQPGTIEGKIGEIAAETGSATYALDSSA